MRRVQFVSLIAVTALAVVSIFLSTFMGMKTSARAAEVTASTATRGNHPILLASSQLPSVLGRSSASNAQHSVIQARIPIVTYMEPAKTAGLLRIIARGNQLTAFVAALSFLFAGGAALVKNLKNWTIRTRHDNMSVALNFGRALGLIAFVLVLPQVVEVMARLTIQCSVFG